MSITDNQIAEIEVLAIKVQQSKNEPWFSKHGLAYWMLEEDANYVSCASPEFVLALITRLREAERDVAEGRSLRSEMAVELRTAMEPEWREHPRYVCRKCKQETRPPEPYKAYVLCDCGYMTAASTALSHIAGQKEEP